MKKRGRKARKSNARSPTVRRDNGPRPIVCFRCSKCLKEFKSYQEAVHCENAHLYPVSAKVVRYTVCPYPFEVEITLNNGEKRVYAAEDLGGGLDIYSERK